MVTPNKEMTLQRAKELFFKDNLDAPTPEASELVESGYMNQAKCELMRNEEKHEVLSYLEQMASEYDLELVKQKPNELKKQIKPSDFEIDVNEALRSGVFICGGKGTTKTNLAKIITDKLLRLGYVVKVFDISKAWLKSSIPYVAEITTNIRMNSNLYRSVMFDLSRLLPKDAKRFISLILAKEWNMQVNLTRLMTTGRNYNLGYIAITQRPALCDTSVFELTFQKYFARMNGENDLRKVANYIGAKAYDLEKLRLGEFFYDKGTETKWITTEEFKPKTKPIELPTLTL